MLSLTNTLRGSARRPATPSRSRGKPRPLQLESLEERTLLSFGNGGIVITDFAGQKDQIRGCTMQTDGKILAAGYAGTTSGTVRDSALARYNTDGSLDTTFDGDGKVVVNMGKPGQVSADQFDSVNVRSDGKIVAVGGGAGGFSLARFNSNGTLDTSFGNNGKVVTASATTVGIGGPNSVLQPADQKIIAVGTGSGDVAVFRYNTNGTLDTTFGNKGKVFTNFGANDQALGVALQSDGRIVIAGRTVLPDGRQQFILARYNVNGTLDTTFDGDGKVITDPEPSDDDFAYSVKIQSDGKIIAAGGINVNTTQTNFAALRYNANGSLDTSFDVDGIAEVDFGDLDEAWGVSIQVDGKIVLAGIGGGAQFAMARLNTDGSLDSSFDSDGKALTNLDPDTDGATSVCIQADGKIVAAGDTFINWAIVRYNTDGSLDSGAIAATTSVRSFTGSDVSRSSATDLVLDHYFNDVREDRDESASPSHLSGRWLADLLRTRSRR